MIRGSAWKKYDVNLNKEKSILKGNHTGAQFLHRCIIYRPGDGGCGSEVVFPTSAWWKRRW